MTRAALFCALLLGACACAHAAAAAPSVRVGAIGSEKKCTLYELTAGRHREAGAVSAYGAAYASETTWASYLVRDCIDNFASLRTSLQDALAASGKLVVATRPGAGAYVVSGRISDVGEAEAAVGAPGVEMAARQMTVNMDVTLRDAGGRIVFGGLMTKRIDTGSRMETQGLASVAARGGQAVYTELQHEVALAVARLVAFRIEPLRVTSVQGTRVQLNYGAPLVQLGSLVQVAAPDGAIVRYRVTGAAQAMAQADYDGGGAADHVAAGAVATVLDADDPAANGRRFERVDLP